MKNLKKLIDPNLDEQKLDQYMSQILQEKFDQELKDKYSKKLSEKYNLDKEAGSERTMPATKKSWVLYAVIAFCLSLAAFFAMKKLSAKSSLNPEEFKMMAITYDEQNPFQAKVLTRNVVDEVKFRAFQDFENENFLSVVEKLEASPSENKEDLFLLAYSHFKLGNYKDAEQIFINIGLQDSDDNYLAEARFYRVMSLFADGKKEEGMIAMSFLAKDSWEYTELLKVINR